MSRPLELSRAIREGAKLYPEHLNGGYLDPDSPASCPLGAAFLGSLHGPADVQKFLGLLGNSSYESACEFIHHGLMKAFPHLGRSVRDYPVLYRRLKQDCPRALVAGTYKSGQYTLTVPRSLFGVITQLHDAFDWPKDRIAAVLAQGGL